MFVLPEPAGPYMFVTAPNSIPPLRSLSIGVFVGCFKIYMMQFHLKNLRSCIIDNDMKNNNAAMVSLIKKGLKT